MSVYTELIKAGMDEEAARSIADLERISGGLVTKEMLTTALLQLEINLAWRIGTLVITAMVALTAINAGLLTIILKFIVVK